MELIADGDQASESRAGAAKRAMAEASRLAAGAGLARAGEGRPERWQVVLMG